MRILAGFVLCLVVLIVAGTILLYSGWYNVAATEPHAALGRWILDTAKHRSIEARADEVQVPAEFSKAQIRRGFEHFRETCVACHGAPGVERSEMGRGLRPQPPPLADVVPEWSTAELFWIAKHGIRMTGMPAWGPTHRDDELWAMVAFVKTLPTMSAEDYRRMEMEAANGRPERAQPERGQGH